MTLCSVEDCPDEARSRGWCLRHYKRWHARGGDPGRSLRPDLGKTLEERVWEKVEKTDTCWIWTGAKVSGYGRIGVKGKSCLAHRVVYELLVGPVPRGKELDHLCCTPECVRPDHLEPVTHRINTQRALKREACRRGHPYTPENTYIRPSGARACRTCIRASDRKRVRTRT